MTWEQSNREAMLEALKEVLEGIEGVRYVERQAITHSMVADPQLPAIIIDEAQTRYRWLERHRTRTSHASTGVVLDLQIRASRRTDGPGANTSTVREAFIARVIRELVDRSTLNSTARDVGDIFDVRYMPVDAPFARALITIRADLEEVFDDRVRTNWKKLIVDIAPEGGESPNPITIDIEEP
ncbi:MAG: hypothetical protein ACNA8W_22805 [Bradymonadaceae bacterium]